MSNVAMTRQSAVRREAELFAAWQASASDQPAAQVSGPAERNAVERVFALEEQLRALKREHGELRQAIFAAAQIQRNLCGAREVRRGRFEIASEIFPVRHLSGDFFQVLDLGEHTGLAVGDIAGKGLAAGLWLAHLAGLVRQKVDGRADLSKAAAAINEDLRRMRPEPPLVALFLARLEHERGGLVYCNAGLPAPLLLRAGGQAEFLETGGSMLGAVPAASFDSARAILNPGDALVCYSDGIVECRNNRGEEFGVNRVIEAARASRATSATNMLFSILGAAQDFAGSSAREDDLTVMVVRCRDMLA